jgi:hypothetical protein
MWAESPAALEPTLRSVMLFALHSYAASSGFCFPPFTKFPVEPISSSGVVFLVHLCGKHGAEDLSLVKVPIHQFRQASFLFSMRNFITGQTQR